MSRFRTSTADMVLQLPASEGNSRFGSETSLGDCLHSKVVGPHLDRWNSQHGKDSEKEKTDVPFPF